MGKQLTNYSNIPVISVLAFTGQTAHRTPAASCSSVPKYLALSKWEPSPALGKKNCWERVRCRETLQNTIQNGIKWVESGRYHVSINVHLIRSSDIPNIQSEMSKKWYEVYGAKWVKHGQTFAGNPLTTSCCLLLPAPRVVRVSWSSSHRFLGPPHANLNHNWRRETDASSLKATETAGRFRIRGREECLGGILLILLTQTTPTIETLAI